MMQIILFYVPVPDRQTGKDLVKKALEARVAACGNLLGPVTSFYEWESEIKEETEFVLLLKTAEAKAEALSCFLQSHHPYECPCITQIPATANRPFVTWLQQQTS